jgi:hypothetical protein
MTAGRLEIDSAGKVTGPASITYNDPFPCENGDYGSGAMMGVVMHTMDGSYLGTIDWFNNIPSESEVSAHFAISNEGQIHQFGPIGKGWCAWAEVDGNETWYSIEHEDDEDPAKPLTDAQITASAQLLEVLSRFAGFKLQISESVNTEGYGTHAMGGVAWGDHLDCPGSVRSAQRAAIVALAQEIRTPAKLVEVHWKITGITNLAKIARQHYQADGSEATPAYMIQLAAAAGHVYGPAMKRYVAKANWNARLPLLTTVYCYKKVPA